MRLKGFAFIMFVTFFCACAPVSPSLKGSTTDVISTRYGSITLLERAGEYELIKVSIPYQMDKVCIVKGGNVIDEYSTYKADNALQNFKSLTGERK